MKQGIAYNRLLMNITLALIFSPLYVIFLAAPQFGVGNLLVGDIATGEAFAKPLLYAFLLGFVVSLGWLLVRGRIAVPLGLFFLLTLTYGFVAGSDEGKRYELLIGAGRPTLGIDVYCNDVHLGKTPLRISEEELAAKVQPWNEPPRQPLFEKSDHSDHHFWSKHYYVPHDIFDSWKVWPPEHRKYNRHDEEESRKEVAETKYWWHFEKDGCAGTSLIANFSGGGGGGNVITIRSSPHIYFRSAKAHLDALMDELAKNDYKASDEWISHFRKYSGLLFLDFYKKVQADERLQSTLDAIVRAEFDIPEDVTRADVARVVDEICDRAERNGCFTVPSLESLAIDMVGKVDHRPIVERFIEHVDITYGYGGRASSNDWTTWRREGKAARALPLECAVRKLRPPELFNRLVYLSVKNESFLDVVGNYRRPEAVRLVQHHLRQVERGKGGRLGHRHNIENAIRLCSKIYNPEIEERLYWFIRENATSSTHDHHLQMFLESRLKSKETNKSRLAEFIFSWAPLSERDKIEWLCKIDSPSSCNYLVHLTRFDDQKRKRALGSLYTNPNPSMDDFLIESYNWLAEKREVKHYGNHVEVGRALANADSEKVRSFLEGKWSESAESRRKLIKILGQGGWESPKMGWLVPLMAKLPENERSEVVYVIENINSAEAWSLIEEWAGGDNKNLAKQAQWYLDRRARRTKGVTSLAAKGADLIAGRIKPDDLLDDAVAYVWMDEGYVPEGGGAVSEE